MDYWWVISIGVAGGVILSAGIFGAVIVVRRVRIRTAREKAELAAESELQMKSLLDSARLMGEDLKKISRELMNVQEDERRKISRELHDEIGQLLATMTVNLELMKKSLGPADEQSLRDRIRETEELAGEMFGRIRTFLRELRPAALDDLGLAVVARRLLHDFSERSGIATETAGDFGILDDLDSEKRIIVFRLMQESLTNVIRHAQAGRIRVEVRREDGCIALEISDDGTGFMPDRVQTGEAGRGGLGILGMRERVRLVDGEFRIASSSEEGTTISVRIPAGKAAGGATG